MQPSSQAVPASQLYTKLKLVGKGAYGSVYKGLDNKSGKVIAIKILNLDTAEDDVTDIQKEITILSDLTRSESVNITPYHGCFLNKTKLWIIMDFAAGGSVRNLMKAGKIEEKYIAVIAREVLMALRYLHKNKIIHRDIKAANILLTGEGNIQLCDFGVAGQTSMNCLKRNSFVGTPYWMAPEVIREGALYDFKADIWSFGITIYEIATGNPPLANQDPMRAIILIPRSKPPQLEGQFSQAIKEFVEQCLNEDPDERPSTDDLLKTKFIRFASKTSSTILVDLIKRYDEWKQEQEAKRSSFTSQDMNNSSHRQTSDIDDEFELSDFDDLNNDAWEFDTFKSEQQPAILRSQSDISPVPPRSTSSIPNETTANQPDLLQPLLGGRPYQRAYSDTHPLVRLFIDTKSAQNAQGNNLSVNNPNAFYGSPSVLSASNTIASASSASPSVFPSTNADPILDLSSANLIPGPYSANSTVATARQFDRKAAGEFRVGYEHLDVSHSPAPSAVGISLSAQQIPTASPHLKPLDSSSVTPTATLKNNDAHHLDHLSGENHDVHSVFDLNTSTTITSTARLTPQQTSLAPSTPRSFEKLSPTGLGASKPLVLRQGSLPDQLPPSRPGSRRPSRATGISPGAEEFDSEAAEIALNQYARRARSTTNLHPEDEMPLKALVTNKHQMQEDDKKGSVSGGKFGGVGESSARHLQNITTSGHYFSSPTSSPTTTMLPELRPLRLVSMRTSEDVYQELSITLNHLDEHLDAIEHALSAIKL